MNSRDMCMIDHVAELMEAGVDSIKLEGRAKSAYYAAVVTGAYRHAVDAAAEGLPLDPVWRDEVEHISHRHYSTGFFFGQPGQFTDDARYVRDWQIVAKVQSCDGDGNAVLTLNNKFAVGDALELVGPDVRPQALTVDALWDGDGLPLEEVRPDPSPVNLNTADPAALTALPGIGEELAARIADYREAHGPFETVEDLTEVPGIGQGKLAALEGLVTVEDME